MTWEEFVKIINQKFRGAGIACVGKDGFYEASIGDIRLCYVVGDPPRMVSMYNRTKFVGKLELAP